MVAREREDCHLDNLEKEDSSDEVERWGGTEAWEKGQEVLWLFREDNQEKGEPVQPPPPKEQ